MESFALAGAITVLAWVFPFSLANKALSAGVLGTGKHYDAVLRTRLNHAESVVSCALTAMAGSPFGVSILHSMNKPMHKQYTNGGNIMRY